jgi:lycopene cyclase CruA
MSVPFSKPRRPRGAPDLSEYRKRYPLTVASFGALPDREVWLDRVWQADQNFREALGRGAQASEAVVRGAPPASLPIEGEFEVIYAGGALGLLHAAVMSWRYKRRVLVLDERAAGGAARGWNVSGEDLRALEGAGLFTADEIEAAVVNRCRSGFVKFHDAGSRVKTPPLWVSGVLDVAVAPDRLLARARDRMEASGTASVMLGGLRFVRCYVEPARVSVEVEEARTGRRRLFAARLFVDATDADSPVSRQLNGGRGVTHVCPAVGTVARGFARGRGPDQVDFNVGEILVSNEDARDHRQLIWEGFAGSRALDEFSTQLFFYDAVDSPADKSLLALFERYFETLPRYKRAGAQWRVVRPVFGYAPAFNRRGLSDRQRRTAEDRVLLVGEAAAAPSPLTLNNTGAHVRALDCQTHLTELALKADLLDAASLSEISAREPRVAELASFAEFLRPTPKSPPGAVNETLNAVMAALHQLDERVRRELFQDRMTFSALKRLLGRTAKLYPRIFQRVREHLGARETFWWLASIASAAFRERRKAHAPLPPGADHAEDAAQDFARHVRLYQGRES